MNEFEDFNEDDIFPHKVLESKYNGMHALQFTDGKFNGIIFSFGMINFPEIYDDDNVKLHFEYDVHDNSGIEYDKDEFEQHLGDFLLQLIMYGIKKNDIVYTGGIDDNNTDNLEQSDS